MQSREATDGLLRAVTIVTAAGSLSALGVFGLLAYTSDAGSPRPSDPAPAGPSTQSNSEANNPEDDGGFQGPQQPVLSAIPGSGRAVSGGSH